MRTARASSRILVHGALRASALALTIALASACACDRGPAPTPHADPPHADPAPAAAPASGGEAGLPTPGDPAAAAAAGEPAPAPETTSPRLALWLPCEGSTRVLDDPTRIPALLDTARALGATDLFVQVYRGGRAWFDSAVVEAGPYHTARMQHGIDPLAALLEQAHAAGLRVHAWMNALSLSTRRDALLLRQLGPDAVMVDRHGRSILDYPELDLPMPDRRWYRMGTPQVWLDPAAPQVAERLAATVRDLLERYPGLDGVHLDYIRHPDVLPFVPGSRFGVGLDFGYGAASRARFQAETGLVAPFGDSLANANRWDAWRRERVTDVVRAVAEAARETRPGTLVSAAVWAYADRAYLSLYQDWRGWLDEGLLDFAVPMAYTLDDRLLRQVSASALGGVGGDRVWIGLGTWLFDDDPARARAQVELVEALAPAGISLFSYDAIAAAPALLEALAPAVAPALAAPGPDAGAPVAADAPPRGSAGDAGPPAQAQPVDAGPAPADAPPVDAGPPAEALPAPSGAPSPAAPPPAPEAAPEPTAGG